MPLQWRDCRWILLRIKLGDSPIAINGFELRIPLGGIFEILCCLQEVILSGGRNSQIVVGVCYRGLQRVDGGAQLGLFVRAQCGRVGFALACAKLAFLPVDLVLLALAAYLLGQVQLLARFFAMTSCQKRFS